MSTFQDLIDATNQKNKQQQVLSQPSMMDNATNGDGSDVDPQGTTQIQQAQRIQDAMNTGAGQAMGTIGGPSFTANMAEAAVPELSMAQKIQQAAQNSNVKVIPSAYDNEIAKYANNAQGKPNIFDTARQTATDNGIGASPQEQAAMQNQAQATQIRIANRNAQQLADRKNIQFQQLLNSLKGK